MSKKQAQTAAAPAPAAGESKQLEDTAAADTSAAGAQTEGVTNAAEAANAAGTVTVEDADDSSKAAADAGDKFPHLFGSNVQPAVLEFAGHKVELGAVVAAAFDKSGMTVEAWNAQDEATREKAIADVIAFGHEQAALALEAERRKPKGKPEYVVLWHVKTGGKLWAPGEHIPADLVTDAMLVPGGSVAKV